MPARMHSECFSELLARGFLEQAGVVQSFPCLNRDAPHDAEIMYHKGRDGFFYPDTGFVPVSAKEINAVRASVSKMIDALALAFDCRARKSSPSRKHRL